MPYMGWKISGLTEECPIFIYSSKNSKIEKCNGVFTPSETIKNMGALSSFVSVGDTDREKTDA